jgi:predicted enzyme related to lactoylglutathione lyase
MDPVVHFEMPVDDKKRVSEFYSKVFGWQLQQLGEEYGDYIVVMTTESDDKGPLRRGVINGGFYQYQDNMPDHSPSFVIAVRNLNESVKKIKDAGGEIIGEPMNIPGVGLYVSFRDTEGNRLSILEPPEGMS